VIYTYGSFLSCYFICIQNYINFCNLYSEYVVFLLNKPKTIVSLYGKNKIGNICVFIVLIPSSQITGEPMLHSAGSPFANFKQPKKYDCLTDVLVMASPQDFSVLSDEQ